MLTPSPPRERGEDVRRIKGALAAMGAEGLCDALGLCEGPPRPSRGSWWRTARGVCVLCPAHNDTRPSCNIDHNGTELVWLCRSCKAGGSALDLVAVVAGIDAKTAFRGLLDHAARIAGVADTRGTSAPRPAPSRPARPPPPPRPVLDLDTFARVADVILAHPLTALDRHPEPPDEREGCPCGCVDVRRYLEDRGVLSLAMRDTWRSLPTRAEDRAQIIEHIVAAVGESAWQASGLRYLDREFKRVHHRVIVPWRDRSGRVTALQRRFLLVAPFEPQCPACDRRGRCAAYPHRRLITSVEDERIPAAAHRAIAHGGKYDNTGGIIDPYGAHRLDPEVEIVAFVEGAADALALEELHQRGASERSEQPSPFVALAIGSTGAWDGAAADWCELARGRHAVVALDDDEKPDARETTDALAERMAEDLAVVAASVSCVVPRVEGARVKDWGEALEAVLM